MPPHAPLRSLALPYSAKPGRLQEQPILIGEPRGWRAGAQSGHAVAQPVCAGGGNLGMLGRSLHLLGRSLGQRAGGQSERAGARCVLKGAEGAESIPLA